MIEGTTSTGFKFRVDDEKLADNWEFVELMSDLDDKPFKVAKIVRVMIGEKQYADLRKHCTVADGHISSKRMNAEVNEIFNYGGNNETVKNS